MSRAGIGAKKRHLWGSMQYISVHIPVKHLDLVDELIERGIFKDRATLIRYCLYNELKSIFIARIIKPPTMVNKRKGDLGNICYCDKCGKELELKE